MYQTDPPRSPKEVLPTMYDLLSEDPEQTERLVEQLRSLGVNPDFGSEQL